MATIVVDTVFKLKRGTAARWDELNPILELGEPGFVKDENRLKIGYGETNWKNLPYIGEDNVKNYSTHFDFPSIGRGNVIYKAEDEKMLYQWNTKKFAYEQIGSTATGGIVIDTVLSLDSENPVQNKVITSYLHDLEAKENARPVNKLLSAQGDSAITLAAADNKSLIEKMGECGNGLYTVYLEEGVKGSPEGSGVLLGLCQVTSWNGLEDFSGWINLFDSSNNYVQYIHKGIGMGWMATNVGVEYNFGDGLNYDEDTHTVSAEDEIVNVVNFNELPTEGNEEAIYKVRSEGKIYQWNSNTKTYEAISGSSVENIKIINGGNANG